MIGFRDPTACSEQDESRREVRRKRARAPLCDVLPRCSFESFNAFPSHSAEATSRPESFWGVPCKQQAAVAAHSERMSPRSHSQPHFHRSAFCWKVRVFFAPHLISSWIAPFDVDVRGFSSYLDTPPPELSLVLIRIVPFESWGFDPSSIAPFFEPAHQRLRTQL